MSSHGHSHLPNDELAAVPVNGAARMVLLAVLALAAVGTLVGLVQLWPDHSPKVDDPSNAFAAPGVTFQKADVVSVRPACPVGKPGGGEPGAGTQTCGVVKARLTSGSATGTTVQIQVAPEVSHSGLRAGDVLEVMQTPASHGAPSTFSFFSVHRDLPIGILAAIFVILVAAVARLRGVLALVGLGFGAFVLVKFMLPALLLGSSGLGVAIVGSAAIMFVVLYLAHGVSMRTSAALAGTLAGIGVTALIAVAAVHRARLSGISDETGALLSGFVGTMNFQGLLTCAVIVAGLGVLNDVTITQASAVWELRGAAPEMPRRELFTRAMRIGRDHIASTIYTIVFAYAGAALSVLLLLYFYQRPVLSLVSTEEISEEIVRTLASGIGLVLAVPITTAIAVLTVATRSTSRSRGRRRAG